MLRRFSKKKRSERIDRDEGRQRHKAAADDPQCKPFGLFSLLLVDIAVKTPKESGSTDNLDHAVEAETD
jgi:hypothetical protein